MNRLSFICTAFLSLLLAGSTYAQRGKDGAGVIGGVNTVVNAYTSLTADAAAGATSITVASNVLNTNFTAPLGPGDLIMIIQVQGATINGIPPTMWDPWSQPRDSSWGAILAYNNCGLWEMGEVYSISGGTGITLDCPLINNYTAAGKVVVVRVPRYLSLTVNSGGSITCTAWNGTIGGICAIEVLGNTTITGSIDLSGRGFRGGALSNSGSANGSAEAASLQAIYGAEKGEGIAGYQADYDVFGGRYCAGSPANGGGGGNNSNTGGGGGANGGNPASWNGHGNPDLTGGAPWVSAWNLHWSNFSTYTSSGGGQGGYSFSSNNANATTQGPGNAAWGGENRQKHMGFGGRPLDYTTGRLFLGGGGGSGDQNDGHGSGGAIGGGLLYLMSYGSVSGAGTVVSNGNTALNTNGSPPINGIAGDDGAGGGGGGGTLIINSVLPVTTISLTANGGKGGDQLLIAGGAAGAERNKAYGPGGGGGGGYISLSNAGPVQTILGGANGVSGSLGVTEFTPNGATRGGAGSTGTVTNFVINAPDVTICAGQAATLTATLNGTVPGGTTIIWYDASVAGNNIGTGAVYTTTVIATAGTYTYYVGTCPGTYHQPVIITVTAGGVISAGADVTVCASQSTTLNASGGTSYAWSPTTGLSNPNISNPVATVAATTTYICTANTSCGQATDTVIVNITPGLTGSITGNTTICTGGSTTLTASGGGNYSWNTGATTTSISVSPTTNTTYSVFVGTGACADTVSVLVNVSGGITASITASSTTICPGTSTTLTGNGGSNYSWNTGATTGSITVTPTATTTYTVLATSGTCSSTATFTLTVANNITATITGSSSSICPGSPTTLTASGGSNYSWNTGATTGSITVTPTASATYTVLATSGTCSSTATFSLTVTNNINASITGGGTTICAGGSATLNVSGGNNYSWNTGATTSSITVTPTTTTTYSVIASSGTCADTTTATVTVSSSITASISGNPVVCGGNSATLTASGGNTFSWSNGLTTSSIIVTPTSSTNYSVTVSSGSCSSTTSITVTVSPAMTLAMGSVAVQCGTSTGLASVNVNSGGTAPFTYLWSPGGQTTSQATGLTAGGGYTVTVTDGAGCTAVNSVTVTAINAPFTTIAGNNVLCTGDATTLTASGGNTYSWSTGATTTSINITPSATATYTVISFVGSCTDTETVVVQVLAPPIAAAANNTTVCPGTSVTLTGSGGNNYSWTTGQTTSAITVNATATATYSVIVANGSCSDTASATITVVPTPTASITSNPAVNTICSGDAIVLNATGGVTYSWNNGNTSAAISVSPSATTSYTVTAANGTCSDTSVITVTVLNAPVAVISGSSNICDGFAAVLTASGGTTYSWSSGETTNVINPTTGGSYSVVVTTGSCSDTAVVNLVVNPLPTAVAFSDITIIQGQSTTLSATGGISYVWDNSMTGATITVSPLATTEYCVTVYDANGCTDSACATVTIEHCTGVIYLPNAFSPNGDGDNDSLQIYYRIPQCIESMKLELYNRWGEKVYETTDPAFRWNGVYNSGALQNTDKGGHEVYAYHLVVRLVDGTNVNQKGNVTLLK